MARFTVIDKLSDKKKKHTVHVHDSLASLLNFAIGCRLLVHESLTWDLESPICSSLASCFMLHPDRLEAVICFSAILIKEPVKGGRKWSLLSSIDFDSTVLLIYTAYPLKLFCSHSALCFRLSRLFGGGWGHALLLPGSCLASCCLTMPYRHATPYHLTDH